MAPGEAVSRKIVRGLKCWVKLKPALKGTRLSHRARGRFLMTYVYSSVAFSCQSRAARQRDIRRLQSVMDTACRYVFRTRLSRMKDQHSDLRALLHIERDIWLV